MNTKPLTHVYNLSHGTCDTTNEFLATLKEQDFIAWIERSYVYHCMVLVVITANGESAYNANNCNNSQLLNIINRFAL